MINLEKFFAIQFNTKNISDVKMERFTFDHIQRLIANNQNHEYDALIDAIVFNYENYFGAITNEDISQALQKSYTRNVDIIINDFKQSVRDKEVLINYRLGRRSSKYLEFFPRGLSEYDRADKTTVENLMVRMTTVGTKYVALLGQPFVNLFTKYAADYRLARELQGRQKGIVTAEKTESEKNRDGVEIQLNRNLLILAEKFLGNPSRGMDFFDQSIIRRAAGDGSQPSGGDDGEIVSKVVLTTNQGTIKQVEIGIKGPAGKKCTIFWGDGTKEEVTCTGYTQFFNHIYTMQGEYDISMDGEFDELEEFHSNESNLIAATIKNMKFLKNIILQNNNLDEVSVDDLLIEADKSGVLNGVVNLLGSAAPSAAGLVAKANLEAKGWMVLVS